MYKHVLILPDGTVISSGIPGEAAICGATLTRCVNTGKELMPGAVCADMLEITVLSQLPLAVEAGQEVTLLQESREGTRTQVGIFILEKPQHPSANIWKLVAYDRVSRLDQDLTQYLASLTGWPYSLHTLAQMVCAQCGLELAGSQIPNGSYLVQKFTAQGITGRQLMQWIAQASCRFCRATADGRLEFAWYTPVPERLIAPGAGESVTFDTDSAGDVRVESAGITAEQSGSDLRLDSLYLAATYADGDLALQARRVQPYYQGSLQYEDYRVAPIDQVRLQLTEEDVGTVYPDTDAKNACVITGNQLLSAATAQELLPVAQTIYETLRQVVYTPCSVSVSTSPALRAGDVLTLTDPAGRQLTLYVMEQTQNAFRTTLKCTGSPSRESTSARNSQSYQALSGKVLELRTDVEGIRARNRDAAGNLSELNLTVEGIRAEVTRQEQTAQTLQQQLTAVEQTAEQVRIQVNSLRDDGASKVTTGMGYTFGDDGLRIARQDSEMENTLDETGMYVRRAGGVILQANSQGVEAVDVQVRNYLCIGDYARLENYPAGRTACFYTGTS